MNYHNGWITKEMNNGKNVFTFGSNTAGKHGSGAAKTALEDWGAIYGQGVGFTGDPFEETAFGIPTKDADIKTLPLQRIQLFVQEFKFVAKTYSDRLFLVTRIGCGLAGYKDEQIAPMFKGVPDNVYLPPEWKPILEPLAP